MSISPTAIDRIAELVAPVTVQPGDAIGPYSIIEMIGEGGFGVVYLADQREPVRRRVALKVVKPGMDTREVLARFEAERQALALMDHPNVAKVFDAGVSVHGRPYFAMEYVPGPTITRFADAQKLTVRQRLELFIPVCHAVQHAHQKGIIHRDLKPSNILVCVVDGLPIPKVIDFGIAKATHAPLTERTFATVGGRLLGTPEYMSPEQAGPDSIDVDTRADVYSLGVVLYELLTGAKPFDATLLRDTGYEALVRMIRDAEPSRPSVRFGDSARPSEIASLRSTDPRSLTREIKGDLDWIVLKAMEKARAYRYETANALAMDVRRHLTNEPVLAGPPSARYKFAKFARRNRTVLTGVGGVTLALCMGLVAAGYGLIQARHERDVAKDAERRARDAAQEVARQRDNATRAQHEAQTQRDEAVAQKTEAERQREAALRGEAALSLQQSRLHVAQAQLALSRCNAVLASAELLQCAKDHRGWEWYALAAQLDASAATLYWPGKKAQCGLYTRDGRQIVTGGADITVWDSGTCRPLRSFASVLSTSHQDFYRSLALSPDHTRLLTARVADDKVELWNFETGSIIGSLRVYDDLASRKGANLKAQGDVQFSPDGARLLTSGWIVRVFDSATLAQVLELDHGAYVRGAAYSPDGSMIATAGNDSRLKLWNAVTGALVKSIQLSDTAWGLAFSPDGKSIAVGGQMQPTVLVFDVQSGQVNKALVGEGSNTSRVAFSPDGSAIAAASFEGVICVWSARQGALLRTILGPSGGSSGITFSPDGTKVLTPQWGGYAKVWDVSGIGLPTLDLSEANTTLFQSLSASGTRLVSMEASAVSLWDLTQRIPRKTRLAHDIATVWYVTASPDGSCALTAGRDGSLKLWDAQGTLLRNFPPQRPAIVGAAIAPDNKRLALVGTDGAVRVVSTETEEVFFRATLGGSPPDITFAAFSDSGSTLALASKSAVMVWNIAEQRELFAAAIPAESRAGAVALSPDASRVAAFWENNSGRAWEIASGRLLFSIAGSSSADRSYQAASFSGDGSRIAVLGLGFSRTNALRLLDSRNGEEVFTLQSGSTERFVAAAFVTPGRERLVALTSLGAVRQIDPSAGRWFERSQELREAAKAEVARRFGEVSGTDLNDNRDLFVFDNRAQSAQLVVESIVSDSSLPEDLRRAALDYMIDTERETPRWP